MLLGRKEVLPLFCGNCWMAVIFSFGNLRRHYQFGETSLGCWAIPSELIADIIMYRYY